MNRFAELLDRLAYEPGRNNKLRLMTEYFRTTGDPERGFALAALTGSLSFRHAKPSMIRALIWERTDPVLFELSHDYVGDLSETVALMWPTPSLPANAAHLRGEKTGRTGSESSVTPSLSTVVSTLASLGKSELPAQLARWLDALDETGRWALLKLVTAELRIGVSARLAKAAAAALGGKDTDEIELLWPSLMPPYVELFDWLEGRAEKPSSLDPAPFRPPMLAHAVDESDLAALSPSDFVAEWKWDGIRIQAVAGVHADGRPAARLYSRTGEDISMSFPDLIESLRLPGAIDGELLIMRNGRVQSFNVLQQRLNRKTVDASCSPDFRRTCAPMIFWVMAPRSSGSGRSSSAGNAWKNSSAGSTIRASISPRWCRFRAGRISPPRARIRPPPEPAPMPKRSRALCSSAATRPMCRAAPRVRGGNGNATRSSSMPC
jgi:DNA ligase-1